ncbi:MAG: hypothetical protein ACK4N4_06490 [Burkholderiales bacterium]
MNQRKFRSAAFVAILTFAMAPLAYSGNDASAGQKLDSGLGKLPHYSQWAQHPQLAALAGNVPGESLDSGLGKLPHYSQWAQHPRLASLVVAADRITGEKLDSGLGELPHYSLWVDSTGKQRLDIASRR